KFACGGTKMSDCSLLIRPGEDRARDPNERRRKMQHPVASHEEWLAARRALLEKEKQLTRLRDEINAERLALPWVKVEKEYVFDTVGGRKTLANLFEGRSQLIVQHFMF